MHNKTTLLKQKILTKIRLRHKETINSTIRPQASSRAPRISTKDRSSTKQ